MKVYILQYYAHVQCVQHIQSNTMTLLDDNAPRNITLVCAIGNSLGTRL